MNADNMLDIAQLVGLFCYTLSFILMVMQIRTSRKRFEMSVKEMRDLHSPEFLERMERIKDLDSVVYEAIKNHNLTSHCEINNSILYTRDQAIEAATRSQVAAGEAQSIHDELKSLDFVSNVVAEINKLQIQKG